MLTYQNYAAYTSKPSKEEKRKIVVSKNSKKTPANNSFPFYYPPQISPNFPKVYPPIIEPPKPVYPKFN